MKKYVQPKFSPDGQLLTNQMMGHYDSYPPGTRLWAECIAGYVEFSLDRMLRESNPTSLCKAITVALTAEIPPWEIYPEEANGDPEAWMRMVTLASWAEVEAAVKGRVPEAWREIEAHLAKWEAEHRKDGNPTGARDEQGRFTHPCATHTDGETEDKQSARGIRRRLLKRAQAGDTQAAELVEQLKAGTITVNQAAIAAGMRQEYMRVRMDHPAKAATSMLQKMGAEWCQEVSTTWGCKLPLN